MNYDYDFQTCSLETLSFISSWKITGTLGGFPHQADGQGPSAAEHV